MYKNLSLENKIKRLKICAFVLLPILVILLFWKFSFLVAVAFSCLFILQAINSLDILKTKLEVQNLNNEKS